MNDLIKRNRKQPAFRALESLGYEKLEDRQLLAVGHFGDFTIDSTHHIAQDSSSVIVSKLMSAPEITQQPEYGQLEYDSSEMTLTYRPDTGFTGEDAFLISTGTTSERTANEKTTNETTYSIRVWETVYATPDWQLVQPGTSSAIDVLANDYAFLESSDVWSEVWLSTNFNTGNSWQQDTSGLTIVQASVDSANTVSISQDGKSIVFDSQASFSGTDVVTYVIEDQNGHRSETTVTLEVSADLDPGEHRFVNEAHWEHQQIQNWLEIYASSLTSGNFEHYVTAATITGELRFETVDSGFTGFAATQFNKLAGSTADQVEGIQEGDIVKSNGDLLYYVTHQQSIDGGQSDFQSYISIVDLSDPANPLLVSTTGFEQRIHDIFLSGDRMAVVTEPQFGMLQWLPGPDFVPNQPTFDVMILDVSNPQSVTQVSQATVQGTFEDARLVGDQLYIVSNSSNTIHLSPFELVGSDAIAVSPGDYVDSILDRDGSPGLPTVTVQVDGESKVIEVGFDQIVRRGQTSHATLVTTFDLQGNNGAPVDMDLVQSGYTYQIYASSEAIYLFDSQSVIKMEFNQDQPGVSFAADGQIPGQLQSQFAADEFDGYLRIATQDRMDRSNGVYVLQQIDDALVVVGSVEDLAPGERIFATRFEGNQVYVVTFELVDPLFVINLTDPTSPFVAGELKIPGVSNHLEWIGDGLLLAIGRDANETTGAFGDLQVSLFDISDSANPELLDRYSFEGGSSTQTPLFGWIGGEPNRQAMTFDAEYGLLALPVYSSFGSGQGTLFQNNDSAIALFQIDRENGVLSAGQVEFDEQAQRTAIVGDHFVFLAQDTLKTAERTSPTVILATFDLPAATEGVAKPPASNTPVQQVDPPATKPDVKTDAPDSKPGTDKPTVEHKPEVSKPDTDVKVPTTIKQLEIENDIIWLTQEPLVVEMQPVELTSVEPMNICLYKSHVELNAPGISEVTAEIASSIDDVDWKTASSDFVSNNESDQFQLDAFFSKIASDSDDPLLEIMQARWLDYSS